MELGEGEQVICEGTDRGDRIVFTNRRICILAIQQAMSFREVRNPRYKLQATHPLETVKEVYAKTVGYADLPKMVTELNDGTKLECEFKTSGNWHYLFWDIGAAVAHQGMKKLAVIDRCVNAVRDAISERKNLITHEDKIFCRYCGNKNPLDSIFCESCGKKIG